MRNFQDKISFIWSLADLLRGDYRESEYGKVVLPMTLLKRLDSVLAETKEQVLNTYEQYKDKGFPEETFNRLLNKSAGKDFYNISPFTFETLKTDPENIEENLKAYIRGFSKNIRDIIEHFEFERQIEKLNKTNILYNLVLKFSEVELHPDNVTNLDMGYIFEELIRKFAEKSNETAGEHFTPREVIKLMISLLFIEEDLTTEGIIRSVYDPTCGTGGILAATEEFILEKNPTAKVHLYGQELNDESYAICKADMILKGYDSNNVQLGDTLANDKLSDKQFDYIAANPPYGMNWQKSKDAVESEYKAKGMEGRFGAGLPRVNDGSLLFVQHMVSKMKNTEKGSRIGIVLNGSPLFSGGAGSGESEIRKWLLENDLVEAIVGLPDKLFYNTGISTYIWILSNRKSEERKGKVQLIDGRNLFVKMRKSLGEKRHEITSEQIQEIITLYRNFEDNDKSKIFDNEDFGFRRVTVERPLRLNFQFSLERIASLKEQSAFQNLATSKKKGELKEQEIAEGVKTQNIILQALSELQSEEVYTDSTEFIKILEKTLKGANIKVSATVKNAISSALSEKDKTAHAVLDNKGKIQADTDLRDTENIPLKIAVEEYFNVEILPHVSDAWLDDSKTVVGYEIPFTRQFYQYEQLRSLEEVETDIKSVEQEILELLKEVMA